MDIGSGKGYPAAALSNFSPHPFVMDGVLCASMEGLLQSFKVRSPEVQAHVCSLVGRKAKAAGRKHDRWKRDQILFWAGEEYQRRSEAYQTLLDRAFDALALNAGFRRALLASGTAVLEHSIGRGDPADTVLTRTEFCRRLTKIRERFRTEEGR